MIVLVLALQLWTLLFVGFFGSELLGTYPGIRIAAQLLFVLPLLAWAVLRLRGPRRALDWAVLAALAALLVVSAFSADVQGSLESVGLALAYALTFFAMRDLGAVPRLRSAVAVAATFALVFWLLMAAAWWVAEKVAWVSVFGSVPNLESYQVFIWGTANVYPVLSLLAVPLLRWQPPGAGRRVLIGLWAIASVLVIPMSTGRAGWLGILVAVVAYDFLSGWAWVRGAVAWCRARRVLLPVAALVGAVALVVAVFVALHVGPIVDSALDGRGPIWREALALFGADPLTGGGPSTYSWLRLTTVPDYTYSVPVRLAHSVPLLTLADGGLVLVAGLLALVAVFARAARPHLADPRRRTAVAVLVGFAAASFFDDFSSLSAVMAVVVALAAWTVAEPLPAVTGRLGFVLPVALAAAGLLVLPSIIGVDSARVAADAGRQAAVAGDWPLAAHEFAGATDAYPTDAGYQLGLGLALSETGGAAAPAYGAARTQSPGDPRSWAALAALTDDPVVHIPLLEEAARRTVLDPTFSFELGRALDAAGRPAAAIHAYAVAVAIDRSLITTFSGEQRAAVEAAVDAVLDEIAPQAALGPDGVRWDLALADDRLPPDMGAAWRAVYLAMHGSADDARAAATQATAGDPYSRTTLLALQAVARLTCDKPRYDAITTWVGEPVATRSATLTIIREHTYRENALSSYQPPSAEPMPAAAAWPWSLIGDPPACPGWSTP
jgi:O-antigen ligase